MEVFLSSAKRGYGLFELMSDNKEEYWSTDDALPHTIIISFPRKTYVYSLVLMLSHSKDESYTPENIRVHFADKVANHVFREPEGEVSISIDSFVFDIHLIIVTNHTDGKDSHVRGFKVMASPDEQIPLLF